MNLTGLLNYGSLVTEPKKSYSKEHLMFVANSIKLILEELFLKVAPSFLIVISCRHKMHLNFYLNIMQHLFHLMDDMIIQLVIIERNKTLNLEGPSFYNLLLVDSLEAFLDIGVITYTRDYNIKEHYHMFLIHRDRYLYSDMKGIFDYCWSNNIVHCNIQLQNFLGEVLMYTYFPFTQTRCGNTEPQRINQFLNNSWVSPICFHSKLKNLYGCPLMAVVRETPPFLVVSRDQRGNNFYKGFEMDLVEQLEKRINFSLKIRAVTQDDHEPLKMLSQHTVDMAFGFYHKRIDQNNLFTSTFPHHQTNIVSVIYLPAYYLNTFQVLSYPFSLSAWALIFSTLITFTICTQLMRLSALKSISLFSMIACGLGSPINREPMSPHSMVIFTSWLWASYVLRNIYSGLLFELFYNVIHTSLPITLDEALNASYHVIVNSLTYDDIQNIPFLEGYLNHSSIILDSKDDLIALRYMEQKEPKYFIGVIYQEFLNYYTKTYQKSEIFYTIPENVLQQQLCFYLNKHSYLVNRFDEEIMNIHAVGLIQFWEKRYLQNRFELSSQTYQDARITQEDLWGIYMLCGVLYLMAFVVFVIERLMLKLKYFNKD